MRKVHQTDRHERRTEQRVRGHIAICVLAALIETLIEADLRHTDIRDPQIDTQYLTARRALRELNNIRQVTLTTPGRTLDVVTRPSPLQAAICEATGVNTRPWNKPALH